MISSIDMKPRFATKDMIDEKLPIHPQLSDGTESDQSEKVKDPTFIKKKTTIELKRTSPGNIPDNLSGHCDTIVDNVAADDSLLDHVHPNTQYPRINSIQENPKKTKTLERRH